MSSNINYLQGSASEGILLALLAAKEKKTREVIERNPSWKKADIRGRLIAYSSGTNLQIYLISIYIE